MKKHLFAGALIVVIGVSAFFWQKELLKLADYRADQIYLETVAQVAKSLPTRSAVQRIVNTPEEKRFLEGWVKQEYKGEIFAEQTIKGKLAVIYQDEFSKEGNIIVDGNGEDIKNLYLVTSTETLRVENTSDSIIEGMNGIEVELTGFLSSDIDESGEKKFVVNIQEDKIRSLESRSKKPTKDWSKIDERGGEACGGNYCAFIVLLDTTNGSTYFDIPTPQEMHDIVFVNPGRIKQNFYEQSYGQMTYGGTVTNTWLQFPLSDISTLTSAVPAQVQQYILDNNVNMDDYDQLIYVIHEPLYAGAFSSIGPMNQVINGQTYSLARTVVRMLYYYTPISIPAANGNITYWERQWIHETGHALGANHDNMAACEHGPTSLPSECVIKAAGNLYSTMGHGVLGSHFSFFKKREVGWINDANIVSGQNGGSFTLKPIQLVNPQIVTSSQNWNTPTQGTYYFESREPTGFDSIPYSESKKFKFNGVFVYRELPGGYPLLTDVSPASSSEISGTSSDISQKDAVLKNGVSLSSAGHGLQFTGLYNTGSNSMAFTQPAIGVTISPTTATCITQPLKIFNFYNGLTNITAGQIPRQGWPQTAFVSDLSQIKSFAIDNTIENVTVALELQYRMFNDDSVACDAAQIERSIYLDGQLIEGPTLSSIQPWSFLNTTDQLAIPGYNLAYGQHAITLIINKLSDGSSVSYDLLFDLVPE